jgi:hypothetical protein
MSPFTSKTRWRGEERSNLVSTHANWRRRAPGTDRAYPGQSAPALSDAAANRKALEVAVVNPTLNERTDVSVLVQRLACALGGIAWEAIFVDGASVDGNIDEVRRIAQRDIRIRGIRRISRRGPAGASLEGMLAFAQQKTTADS